MEMIVLLNIAGYSLFVYYFDSIFIL